MCIRDSSKSFRFSDINYLVANREDKESMFLTYSELLNSLDSGATTKITINNHRLNRSDFEESILMPMKQDGLDEYRKEYNDMLLDKATGANGITQKKYITITVAKKDIEEARAYFARIGADLTAHFANLGSKCVPLNAVERLRILHDFYRPGDEAAFSFDMNRKARLGHDFRDYICPDSVERTADHIKLTVLASLIETPDTRVFRFVITEGALAVTFDELPELGRVTQMLFQLVGITDLGFLKRLLSAAQRENLGVTLRDFTAPTATGVLVRHNG